MRGWLSSRTQPSWAPKLRSPEEKRGGRSRRSIDYRHDPRPDRIFRIPLELWVAFERGAQVFASVGSDRRLNAIDRNSTILRERRP